MRGAKLWCTARLSPRPLRESVKIVHNSNAIARFLSKMNSPLQQFFTALNAQEEKIVPEFEVDRLGVILRCAINELDWYYYNYHKTKNPTFEQDEHFYILKLGVARLIKISLDARPSFDVPVVMFRRDLSKSRPVLEIAGALGMIEHGRRVAQSIAAGVCRIDFVGKNEFLITLPPVIANDEYRERIVSEHYRLESRKQFAEMLKSEIGEKIGKDVEELLAELVFPFAGDFIGYGGDVMLDEYFFSLASHEVGLMEGYDTFHYRAKFGGVAMHKYMLALQYFLSNFIRHERFAEALVKKHPEIKMENILTITSDTPGFVESIKDALNHFGPAYEGYESTSIEEAQQIFEVLSVSRKNTGLLSSPSSPLPLLIQCSDRGVIRCLAASSSAPMQFLLDSLRFHFPSDYNKNQQAREKSMQLAVKRVLSDVIDGLTYFDNIKVKLEGRFLTDIDLVVLEKSTGSVYFCQLKHQELYGTDLHAKQIRTTRLKEQSIRWLSAVDEWIERIGDSGVRSTLRLSKDIPPLIFYRLIISRHYSHPLKDLVRSPDRAGATWNQFFNAVEILRREDEQKQKTLAELLPIIKRHLNSDGKDFFADEPSNEWIIDDLKFTVQQEKGNDPL